MYVADRHASTWQVNELSFLRPSAGGCCRGWLGLILGNSLWYPFYSDAVDTDEKFSQRMDALVREVGERGKIKTKPSTGMPQGVPPKAVASAPPTASEPTPEPAPAPEAPAPAPVTPMTPNRTALAPAAVLEAQQQFSPSLQILSPAVQQHTALVNAGTLSEMAAIFKEQRDDARAERLVMETRMEQQRVEAKAERAEMQAKMEAERAEMQAKMAEMQAKMEAKLEQQQVITKDQLAALQTRLEGLHASELLSDDEGLLRTASLTSLRPQLAAST
jgi:cell division septum initiation protein DivIVA